MKLFILSVNKGASQNGRKNHKSKIAAISHTPMRIALKCEIAEGVRNEKIFIDLLRSLVYYIKMLININKTCSKHMINKQILNIKFNSIMYIKVMMFLCYSFFKKSFVTYN